jgi:hypothetical protein
MGGEVVIVFPAWLMAYSPWLKQKSQFRGVNAFASPALAQDF